MRFDVERTTHDVGALISYGTVNNGLVVYIDHHGHLVYDHNCFTKHTVVRSADPVPAGVVELGVNQHRVKGGPAKAEVLVNGKIVGEHIIPVVPSMISPVGIDIGRNLSGVSDAYEPPFTFTGRIAMVVIDTMPGMSPKDEFALTMAAALATQ